MAENREDAVRTAPELRLASEGPGEVPPYVPADEADLPRDRNQAILEAAKQVGAVLKRGGHLFALAGSVAVHAHGGSGNLQHDVDFCVRPEDAGPVAATLRDAGLTVYTPPEDWLIKATCFGQDVDVIFELAEAIDTAGADLAVHGHAHAGSEHGMTTGGVKVRNVAQPVIGRAFHVYHLPLRERVGADAV
ncbi:hypothetical protein AB0N20_14700 [Streptomyces griseoincarnatus]